MFDHHVLFLCAFPGTVLRIRMFLDLLDPDPLGRSLDPRIQIRIRIHTKMIWIRNTARGCTGFTMTFILQQLGF
jgi:hypothetical protein